MRAPQPPEETDGDRTTDDDNSHYKLDTDVKNGRQFTDAKGHLDPGKLRKALTEGVQKKARELTRGDIKFEYKKDIVKSHSETLWDIQPLLNAEANHDPFGTRMWNATASAQAMRYAYGASLSLSANLRKGISLKLDGSASLDLVQGLATVEGFLPDEGGYSFELTLPDKQGRPKKRNLGTYRVLAGVAASGYAGTKLQLTADMACTVEQGRLMLKGQNSQEARALKHKDRFFTPAKAEITGFAGVSGGLYCSGAIQWDNPEARKDGKPGWKPLAQLGGEISASLGLGADAGFYLGYDDGKFMFRAKASVVWGVGAGGDIAATVRADQILELAQYVYHQLKDNDYDYLSFIQPIAFEALWKVIGIGLISGNPASIYACRKGVRWVRDNWEIALQKHEAAMSLAKTILEGSCSDLLKFSVPETKGALLRKLVDTNFTSYSDPDSWRPFVRHGVREWGVHEMREHAIIEILKHVQSMSELREVLEHMGPGGARLKSAGEGDRLLRSILDGEQLGRYHLIRRSLTQRAPSGPVRIQRI